MEFQPGYGYFFYTPLVDTTSYDENNDHFAEMLKWLKSNCSSYYRNDIVLRENKWHYRLFFFEEQDCIWAKLKLE